MFDKHLKDEVKALTGRLETLEQQDVGKTVDELRQSNRELEQANNKLALKLSNLQVIATVVLVVLGILLAALTIIFDQFRDDIARVNKNIEDYRQFEAARPGIHEVLVEVFQRKLGDTLDRISLLAPNEEDMRLVKELSTMQGQMAQLKELNVPGGKFASLSTLTQALSMIVNEGKTKEASDLINKESLASGGDGFVKSRALLLIAASKFTDSLCGDPKKAVALSAKAIDTDSSAVPAYNLRGVCLTEDAVKKLEEWPTALEKKPQLWDDSVKIIRDALRDNDFAYRFKPSPWSKRRFLGNKAWISMNFLLAALPLEEEKRGEALRLVGEGEYGEYKDMQDFFEKSLRDIKECQQLSDQPQYVESEAELYAFEYLYYMKHKEEDTDGTKAKDAQDKMFDALAQAVRNGLLDVTKKTPEEYFKGDVFLRDLVWDPNDPKKLDRRIANAIPKSN